MAGFTYFMLPSLKFHNDSRSSTQTVPPLYSCCPSRWGQGYSAVTGSIAGK
ncbi:hypothetical protein GJ744_001497 [Endocarpon pusillum]|uniref:Uncharacterized protein n=1 Tax=Endocarpon pusillum TaxID=364733 RepID=A0A8H7AA77_9EURO|nr:hypothetical protein GJ744_001497 [Endocarpon pusillum]